MQPFWNKFAFVRLVVWMSAGIILGTFLDDYSSIACVLFIISTVIYLLYQFFKTKYFSLQSELTTGVLAFLICLSFGYVNVHQKAQKHDANHLLHYTFSEVTSFKAILKSKPKTTEKTKGFTAAINAVKIDSVWHSYHGKAMLYLEKDSAINSLRYGDEIVVNSRISALESPKNPLEFNYKRFLGFKQVYFQQYITNEDVYKTKSGKGNTLVGWSIETSDYLSGLLEAYITTPQSLAIAKALTLGVKDDLDDTLTHAYAAAGAMHVLAVSGLHVGIVFLLISLLFKPWKHRAKGRFVFALCSLLGLWAYAFITGLSPSVLRAATMFSFIIVGQAFKRHTNIYNTLAASAFVLLVFNPFLIFSVGFQLSYLAVIGIVFFQPRIYKLLIFRAKILDKIWAITAVSIAAQLATAPLALLYFHQFPTYFFISNLVVIPAAFIILNGSIALLLVSWWEPVAQFLGMLINGIIETVNYLIIIFQQLPVNTIDGVYITSIETWLIYFSLAFIAFFINQKRIFYWKLAFFGIFLGCLSVSLRTIASADEKVFTVYDTQNNYALAIRNGASQYLSIAQALIDDKNKLRFHVYPSQLQAGIANFRPDEFNPINQAEIFRNYKGLAICIWNELLIAHLKEDFATNKSIETGLKVDYLILSNNKGMASVHLFDWLKPKLVIIDASNDYAEIKRLKRILTEKNITFYVVPQNGAFELKI